MSRSMTVDFAVHFRREGRGAPRRLEAGKPPAAVVLKPGRVPRVSRLMALAIRFEEQVRTGVLASYSEIADLGCVTRARISQIANLVNLAPDIQEALLFLPRTVCGRDAIHLRQLQLIASCIDWKKQRRLWQELRTASGSDAPA
jgi:hypothetical protein